MKKLAVLLGMCICLLCSCNSKQTITGQVVAASSDTDTTYAHLIILTHEGKEIGIKIDSKTHVIPMVDGTVFLF